MYYIQSRNYPNLNKDAWTDLPLEIGWKELEDVASRYWELRRTTGIALDLRVVRRTVLGQQEVGRHELLDMR